MWLLLFLSLNAFAIEHLPCQRALHGSVFDLPNGERVHLESDQILLKGSLHAFWETGMEDQTGWSIMDAQVYETLSGNGYDALFPLNKGDRVFILKPDESIFAQGFHDEFSTPGTVNFLGREIEVAPNRPRLLKDLAQGAQDLSDGDYKQAFDAEMTAVVVSRAAPHILQHSNQVLAPKLANLPTHIMDDSRFIAIGSGEVHERAMFEKVYVGKMEINSENLMLLSPDVQVHYGDILYFIDSKDRQIRKHRVDRFPAIVGDLDVIQAIKDAKTCVLIRRLP